jgi:hypothetical protein
VPVFEDVCLYIKDVSVYFKNVKVKLMQGMVFSRGEQAMKAGNNRHIS